MRRALALVLLAPLAHAKGEGGSGDVPCEAADQPRAYAVRASPGGGAPSAIATNFGVLLSSGGDRFTLACPDVLGRVVDATGLMAPAATPTIAVLPGWTIVATGYPTGIRASEDGCGWPAVDDTHVAGHRVNSLAVVPGGPLLAATDTGMAPVGVMSSDDGLAWTSALGAAGSTDSFGGLLAAPDGATAYVVDRDFVASRWTFYRSADAGGSWEATGTADGDPAGVSAIDPADPTHLLLRRRVTGGFCASTDRLEESRDAGATRAARLTLAGDEIVGALVRPDGALWVASFDGGVHVSRDGGATWTPTGPARARCLAAVAGFVAACTVEADATYGLIARTYDEGATWEPWITWDRIDGPPPCLAARCADQWSALESAWIPPRAPREDGGVDASAPTDAGAGEPDASAGTRDAGGDAARRDGGRATIADGAAMARTDGAGGDARTAIDRGGGGGCGCALGTRQSSAAAEWPLPALGTVCVARRMRRRKRKHVDVNVYKWT